MSAVASMHTMARMAWTHVMSNAASQASMAALATMPDMTTWSAMCMAVVMTVVMAMIVPMAVAICPVTSVTTVTMPCMATIAMAIAMGAVSNWHSMTPINARADSSHSFGRNIVVYGPNDSLD
ncbi:hypothetical protein FB639_002992 [Coemansia asiatica]|nr:hypothetical protein FB639_002992 [Coemansia asiatica]